MSAIGEFIEARRRALGMSPAELARRAGISVEHLRKIRRNHIPSVRTVCRLAQVLEVSEWELLELRVASSSRPIPSGRKLACTLPRITQRSRDEWRSLFCSICPTCIPPECPGLCVPATGEVGSECRDGIYRECPSELLARCSCNVPPAPPADCPGLCADGTAYKECPVILCRLAAFACFSERIMASKSA